MNDDDRRDFIFRGAGRPDPDAQTDAQQNDAATDDRETGTAEAAADPSAQPTAEPQSNAAPQHGASQGFATGQYVQSTTPPPQQGGFQQGYQQQGAYQQQGYQQQGGYQQGGYSAPVDPVMLLEYPDKRRAYVRLASKGRRLGAYLLDALFSSIPGAIVSIIFMLRLVEQLRYTDWERFNDMTRSTSPSFNDAQFNEIFDLAFGTLSTIFGMLAVAFLFSFLYFAIIPLFTGGRTLGKMILKLRPVQTSGYTLSRGNIFLRQFVGQLLLAGLSGGVTTIVSAIMILVNDKRQGIHDYICDSVVIDERPIN